MTFARALWADLVEKRLWPVAVLLVVALVGVPIALLSMGGDDGPPPPLPALAAGDVAAAATQPVVVDTSVPTSAPRGHYNDPFRGGPRASVPGTAAAPRSGSASASAGPASASSGGRSSGSAAARPPAPSTGTPHQPAVRRPAPAAAPTPSGFRAGYTVDVHWTGVPHRDLVRRTRLRMGNGMGIVFVGVRHHGKSALFLLTPGLTTLGEGRCIPSAAACQMIELRRGDYELFDVAKEGLPPVRYGLRLDRLAPARARTRLAARRVLSRVSRAGTKLLRQIVDTGSTYVTQFRYAAALGLLVRRADLRSKTNTRRGISATSPSGAPTAP